MSRKKIETVRHEKSGIVFDVYLDGTRFVGSVLNKTLSAPDASVLKAAMLDHIEHWLTLDWHPIIKVNLKDSEGWGNSKEFGFFVSTERFYVSKSPAGKALQVEWEIDPAHRKAQCGYSRSGQTLILTNLPLEAPLRLGKSETWLNYTETKWSSLQAIRLATLAMHGTLSELINTRHGDEKLALGFAGLKLLA